MFEIGTAVICALGVLVAPSLVMATTAFHPLNPTREMVQIGVLVVLVIVLVTQEMRGLMPFVLLGLAFIIAMNGYQRTNGARPPQPWESNDEP